MCSVARTQLLAFSLSSHLAQPESANRNYYLPSSFNLFICSFYFRAGSFEGCERGRGDVATGVPPLAELKEVGVC